LLIKLCQFATVINTLLEEQPWLDGAGFACVACVAVGVLQLCFSAGNKCFT